MSDMTAPAVDGDTEAAYTRARRRVKEVRDFYGHLALYLIVNGVFVLIDLLDGDDGETFLGLDWAYFMLIGWGVFVLGHFFSVFVFDRRLFGDAWQKRKTQQ